MLIVYETSTLEIAGATAHGTREVQTDKAIRLLAPDSPEKYSAFLVADDATAAEASAALGDGRLKLVASTDGLQLQVEPRKEFSLVVTCDAKDVHPVDGIPEIAADGKATTLITVQKLDGDQRPAKAAQHRDELYLRTDQGTLLEATGKKEITRLVLDHGTASFRLRSDTAKRIATVSVFNADPTLRNASIRVEFI